MIRSRIKIRKRIKSTIKSRSRIPLTRMLMGLIKRNSTREYEKGNPEK